MNFPGNLFLKLHTTQKQTHLSSASWILAEGRGHKTDRASSHFGQTRTAQNETM